jgi:hypothetical protein
MFALIVTGFVVLAGSMFWAFTKQVSASTSSLQEGDSRDDALIAKSATRTRPEGQQATLGIKSLVLARFNVDDLGVVERLLQSRELLQITLAVEDDWWPH